MANKCGDPTAASMGRVTINPIPHIDLIGTILIPLLMIIFNPGFGLIGWGKPCPVNPNNFRNYRKDEILVSLAGVVSNLMAAVSSLILLKIFLLMGINSEGLFLLLRIMFNLNLVLMIFNLIPIPPLDGSHILKQVLSPRAAEKIALLDQWGFLILIIIINTSLFDKLFSIFLYPFDQLFWLIIKL